MHNIFNKPVFSTLLVVQVVYFYWDLRWLYCRWLMRLWLINEAMKNNSYTNTLHAKTWGKSNKCKWYRQKLDLRHIAKTFELSMHIQGEKCSLSLNHYIHWTVSVVLMKFSEYGVRILLIYKMQKFHSNPFCRCWYTEVVPQDCIYWHTLYKVRQQHMPSLRF